MKWLLIAAVLVIVLIMVPMTAPKLLRAKERGLNHGQ